MSHMWGPPVFQKSENSRHPPLKQKKRIGNSKFGLEILRYGKLWNLKSTLFLLGLHPNLLHVLHSVAKPFTNATLLYVSVAVAQKLALKSASVIPPPALSRIPVED
eukprot:4343790-Amphidinium_carterae.1